MKEQRKLDAKWAKRRADAAAGAAVEVNTFAAAPAESVAEEAPGIQHSPPLPPIPLQSLSPQAAPTGSVSRAGESSSRSTSLPRAQRRSLDELRELPQAEVIDLCSSEYARVSNATRTDIHDLIVDGEEAERRAVLHAAATCE